MILNKDKVIFYENTDLIQYKGSFSKNWYYQLWHYVLSKRKYLL